MAVRKRTGFKVQKGKSSERLKAANKRLAIANAQIKAAKARSKVAKERSKVAKARIKVAKQKVKSKSKARAIQTKRGVVKARGGGPAKGPTVAKRGGVGLGSLFNPFPEAAAFQAPFKLGWSVVREGGKAGGKAVINPRTKKPLSKAHVEKQPTSGAVEIFHGGMPGMLGTPIGTGQKGKKYKVAVSGDAAESLDPNVFLTEAGIEDFGKASAWWQDYTRIPISGEVMPGKGQGKLLGKQMKDQPGYYMKDQTAKGEHKITPPAGQFSVHAGKGKTKTWIGKSSRLEAGSQPGGKFKYENWVRFLKTPEEKAAVERSFIGSGQLYGSTKAGYTTARARVITGKDLDKTWATISKTKQAEIVSKAPDATKTAYSKYKFHNLPEKMKKDLLKKGGFDF